MQGSDIVILLILFLYPLLLLGYLIFLVWIPRLWRLVGYCFFCVVHLFALALFDALRVIYRNNASGRHAEEFFAALERQLSSGSPLPPEYLEMPGYAVPMLLSVLAVAALVGGGVLVWRKIRWYSWPLLIAVFGLSSFLFAAEHCVDDRRDITERNDLRRRTYALLAEKRAQRVTDRQLAEAIAANRKDFRYSYETRAAEQMSVNRILKALRELMPATPKKERP